MPVDVNKVDNIAAAVASIYREGETALLRATHDRLETGLERTDWQASRLAALAAYRRSAQTIVNALHFTGSREVRRALAAAYRSGAHDAVRELAGQLSPSTPRPGPATTEAARGGARAVVKLAEAVVDELRPVHSAILPRVIDVYRRTVAGAAARRLTGATTTREAAQAAWATLTRNGLTEFTDRSGRSWRLHTYVEMAVRTAVMRAAVHGLVDEFSAAGIRLVSVDDQPGECARCRPYEHRVLALWGTTGRQAVPHARTGQLVTVDVLATLSQAQAAGLHHPHCRHTIRAYLPGVSILLKQGRTADPVGEEVRTRQRALEREARRWREAEAGALTPAARAEARGRVAAVEVDIAHHVKVHGLTRLHYREQIGAGHIPPPGRLDDLAAQLGIPQQPTLDL